MSTVSLIVAVAKNNVIGKDNDLIWFLPKDLKYFKDTTAGHHVIMGRRNYDSIPDQYRPLPGRTNIVVTRQQDYVADNEKVVVVHSVEEGIEYAKKHGDIEPFVIGGGMIYKYALDHDLIDRMYITHIDNNFEGDTYFPEFDEKTWKKTSHIHNQKDHRHEWDFDYAVYEKA